MIYLVVTDTYRQCCDWSGAGQDAEIRQKIHIFLLQRMFRCRQQPSRVAKQARARKKAGQGGTAGAVPGSDAKERFSKVDHRPLAPTGNGRGFFMPPQQTPDDDDGAAVRACRRPGDWPYAGMVRAPTRAAFSLP